MQPKPNYLLYIAIFAGLILGAYVTYRHFNVKDVEAAFEPKNYELIKEVQELKNANLILKYQSEIIKKEIDSLKQLSQNEVLNRSNYLKQKNENKKQIYNNTVDVNKQYNDNYILNYKQR